MTATKTLSLPDQFARALDLVSRAHAVKDIATKQDYEKAQEDYRSLIQHEKELEVQYAALECVIQAKQAQAQKKDLAAKFDAAKKHLKNDAMRRYDDAREAERVAEQNRLAEIARVEAEKETARLVAIQKAEFEKAEKERRAAEVLAKKSKDAAAKAAAQEAARQAAERAEAARQEATAIKADAAAAPAPTVILEKEHQGVTRRKVFKWRLTTKDGRKFVKGDITAAVRLGIADLGNLPPHLYVLSPVLLNDFVDSKGEAAAIPGVLEVRGEMV